MAKIILSAFARALLNIPLWLLSLVVVPLALAFCRREDEHLPRWAWWWDEPTYGINGDPYWNGADNANGHEREYLWRLRWLFRNSLGGWSHYVMGIPYEQIIGIRYFGDPDTSNKPKGRSGRVIVEVALRNGDIRQCLYYVHRWGNSSHCLRAYIGYKLMDVLHKVIARHPARPSDGVWIPVYDLDQGEYAQDVFSPNPLMGFQA